MGETVVYPVRCAFIREKDCAECVCIPSAEKFRYRSWPVHRGPRPVLGAAEAEGALPVERARAREPLHRPTTKTGEFLRDGEESVRAPGGKRRSRRRESRSETEEEGQNTCAPPAFFSGRSRHWERGFRRARAGRLKLARCKSEKIASFARTAQQCDSYISCIQA